MSRSTLPFTVPGSEWIVSSFTPSGSSRIGISFSESVSFSKIGPSTRATPPEGRSTRNISVSSSPNGTTSPRIG